MIKKKISILTLILLFFISTTGLPLTIHLCKMIEAVEVDECLMHNEPVKTSCCEEDNTYKVFINSASSNCCEIKTIDNSLADGYLNPKVEFKSDITNTFHFLNSDIYNYKSASNKFFNISGTSPPSLIYNNLYLINSSLLI